MMRALFPWSGRRATIEALYGAIVAQARLPVFYLHYAVPDTVNGRFEMILIHGGLVLDRLAGGDAAARTLGQGIFDRFCQDMDDTLRERGVSDLAVPREMKRVGEAFYGRQAAYRAGLAAAAAGTLEEALRRNLYAGTAGDGADRMAAYMREANAALRQQAVADMARGRLAWPDPALIRGAPAS